MIFVIVNDINFRTFSAHSHTHSTQSMLITASVSAECRNKYVVYYNNYDYPFSTSAENAVNKRIIERPYANHLNFCKTAVFVVRQRDNHNVN